METPLAVQVAHAHKGFGGRPHNPLTRLHPEGGQATAAGPAPRTVALDDVSFDVRRGEIFGVLGPNGSGKTTLVRLIGSVLMPDGGRVSVFGHDATTDGAAGSAPNGSGGVRAAAQALAQASERSTGEAGPIWRTRPSVSSRDPSSRSSMKKRSRGGPVRREAQASVPGPDL